MLKSLESELSGSLVGAASARRPAEVAGRGAACWAARRIQCSTDATSLLSGGVMSRAADSQRLGLRASALRTAPERTVAIAAGFPCLRR